MKRSKFSQDDLDRIAEAVRNAESKTSGEIVPYFVDQSDDYRVARWRGGVAFAGVAMLMCTALQWLVKSWFPLYLLDFSAIIVGAFILGTVLVGVFPALRRLFLGHSLMDHRVSQRASLAFFTEEVFKTRERTGILIFLSFFERKVVVLGDSGINTRVQQSEWDGIVQGVVKSIKEGKPVDGIVEAIRECGELLEQHGVERRRDDTDELGNSLRVGP